MTPMQHKIHRSKISNTEWGIVIGALLLVDIIQLILDLFVVGVVLNYAIEIIVGLSLPFYLHMRGENMADPKRLTAFLAVFGLEFFIPFVDGLPFWTMDGVYNYLLAKRRDKEADAAHDIEVKEKMQKDIQIQRQKVERINEYRQRQIEQRRIDTEEKRLENQTENQTDDEDLYDQAA